MLWRLASTGWPLQLYPGTAVKLDVKPALAAIVTAPFRAPVWLVYAGRVKSTESSPSTLPAFAALSAFVALVAVVACAAVSALLAVSALRLVLSMSALVSESSLTSIPDTVALWMSPERIELLAIARVPTAPLLMSRAEILTAAYELPPIATNSATSATIMAGDGRLLRSRFICEIPPRSKSMLALTLPPATGGG